MATLTGTLGADTLSGTTADDIIEGLEGNDQLDGLGGDDVLVGLNDVDTLSGGDGNDMLFGDGRYWYQFAAVGDDLLDGGDGNDVLVGGAGDDHLTGGAGDDVLINASASYLGPAALVKYAADVSSAGGKDTIDGGAGNDLAILVYAGLYSSLVFDGSNPGALNTILVDGVAAGSVINVEAVQLYSYGANAHLTGGAGNDLFQGGNATDSLNGGGGDDTLYGDNPADYGAMGDDVLVGGAGADVIDGGFGDDDINGGDGDDFIGAYTAVWDMPPAGATHFNPIRDGGDDRIDGGAGADWAALSYAAHGSNITFDGSDPTQVASIFNGGVAKGTVVGIETYAFYSGVGNDVLTFGAGNDLVYGDAGNDVLHGGAGDDTLYGGPGDDLIDGGAGSDTYAATLEHFGVPPIALTIDLSLTTAQNTGEGFDTLISVENLLGGMANDRFTGNDQANEFRDYAGGDDVLIGGGGGDILYVLRGGVATTVLLDGGSGDDRVSYVDSSDNTGFTPAYPATVTLLGGDGDDTLGMGAVATGVIDAGEGRDQVTINSLGGDLSITLGSGADTLTLAATGGNFRAANAIVVNDFQSDDRLDLSAYLSSALQNYPQGPSVFASGHLRLVQSGGDTLLQADRDGGGDSFSTLMTLRNVAASSLTGLNLAGLPLPAPGVTVNGTPGPENLTGGPNADTLNGGGGDDRLVGGASSDTLNGGAGYDTAVYAGARYNYTIASGGGAVAGGPEGGTDTLTSVERLQFVDGYFSTEASAGNTAGAVYRLYQTMLNRTPDANGLAFWAQQIDFKGSNLKAVANGFIGSPEFNGTYGALNNDQFVELMYANVLHRASDAQGKATWVGLLNSGGTRADVAIGFSESNENVGNLSTAIQKGIWVGDPNAGIAARFYDTVFSRLPDAPGLDTWTKQLNAGASLNTVANGFVASTEFQTTYGALNNAQFVELMYNNVLHRASDSGRQTWLDLLNSGGSRAQVVVGFSESSEHIKLTAPHIDDGVWTV